MTDRPHLIFVDDEPMVLSGLRRMLHAHRTRWDMSFVTDARQALSAMESRRCDLIVSDYRMPIMDGATLLQVVRDRYPATGRVILSGQADQADLRRVVQLAHRFLHKPCREDHLVATAERLIGRCGSVVNDDIVSEIVDVHALPSPPQTLLEQLEEMTSPEQPAQLVVEAIAHDLVSSFPMYGVAGEWIRRVTCHVVETARLARHLAGGTAWAADAGIAGLLVEIGQLVLASSQPALFAASRSAWGESDQPLVDFESVTFGITHAEAGAYLLTRWGLPAPMVESVAGHHRDPDRHPDELASTIALAHAVVEADMGPVCGRAGAVDAGSLRAPHRAAVERWRQERARFTRG